MNARRYRRDSRLLRPAKRGAASTPTTRSDVSRGARTRPIRTDALLSVSLCLDNPDQSSVFVLPLISSAGYSGPPRPPGPPSLHASLAPTPAAVLARLPLLVRPRRLLVDRRRSRGAHNGAGAGTCTFIFAKRRALCCMHLLGRSPPCSLYPYRVLLCRRCTLVPAYVAFLPCFDTTPVRNYPASPSPCFAMADVDASAIRSASPLYPYAALPASSAIPPIHSTRIVSHRIRTRIIYLSYMYHLVTPRVVLIRSRGTLDRSLLSLAHTGLAFLSLPTPMRGR